MHKYSAKEISFIKEELPGRSRKEFAAMFNKRFGTTVGVKALTSTAKRYGVMNGLDARFQKGQISHNKGIKGINYPGMKPTQFKKGNTPHNYCPVGTERVTTDGYIVVKIADPKTWRMKHVLIWEANNGQVPKEKTVVFGDGNRMNCTIDNLVLVSRGELAVMNKCGLYGGSKELTEAGRMVARLRMAIYGKKKRRL